MLELFGKTMCGLHFDVRIANTDKIGNQLNQTIVTLTSVVLMMLLKASIFHLAKSPGNYWPYRERADIILIELPIKSV